MLALATVAACALVGRATIEMLNVSPAQPIPGQNQTLSVGYSFEGPSVTSGSATQTTTVNQIPLQPVTEDLCTQTKCPIEPGSHLEMATWEVPSNFAGTVASTITWKDQNEEPLWCVQMNFRVQPADEHTSKKYLRGTHIF